MDDFKNEMISRTPGSLFTKKIMCPVLSAGEISIKNATYIWVEPKISPQPFWL